jgi:DNA polymerase I-like protein with 3'-5' exonuclease and polymerase domains
MAKPKVPDCICIDFESDKIDGLRPEYPPKPVSFSIQWPADKKPKFFAWGHPSKNTTTLPKAKAELTKAVAAARQRKIPLLFFNAAFDWEIICDLLGIDIMTVDWDMIHDAMYLLFLDNPHSKSLELKPAAEALLGEPPYERDVMLEWCQQNVRKGFAPTKVGEYISRMPGDIVGPYCDGDVRRTKGLFKKLYPDIAARGMLDAYDRERELMPIFLANERGGIRVDMAALRRDIKIFQAERDRADAWLRKKLKLPGLNINSNVDFAEALARNKLVADEDWVINSDGSRSVSKANFTEDMIRDKKVHQVFGYRNRLGTCLNMFMGPWLAQAEINNGRITTHWNQVRQTGGGTRTGRPSTDGHNFLNLSKDWYDKGDGYVHPEFLKVMELPLVRRYVLADKDGIFLHRDYNQQELRIMAHFEDGPLMEAYLQNLRMDVHDQVKALILEVTGVDWDRRPVKIANFRALYGGGAPAAAAGIGCSLEEAKSLLAARTKALPGEKMLKDEIKALSARGEPIITWGGREYYVEEPGWSARFNRHMTYEYKLLNYLVQGSAADATKEALLRYHRHPKKSGRFLVTVYDEINVASPAERTERLRKLAAIEEMAVLRECMESIEFDVPLLTDGKWGLSWGRLEKFKEGPSVWEMKEAA